MKHKTCDVCKADSLHEYVDGATRMGPWANMCMDCFHEVGRGLGTGVGQYYTLVENPDGSIGYVKRKG